MKLHLTTATAPWREISILAASVAPNTATNPLRLAGPAAQAITGFGGCFNLKFTH